MSPPTEAGAPPPGWDRDGSPYHAGEQAVQARAGARETAERAGRRVIRSHMPDQHRTFFAELPFVVLGSRDARGRPWASILVGRPGFLHSPDPRRLAVAARPFSWDPAADSLRDGAPVALLGIQTGTRRRNRMNGRVIEAGTDGFTVAVDQSFGNCPQYIQARTPHFRDAAAADGVPATIRREGPVLSAAAVGMVRAADTFFIATASPGAGGDDPVEGADVSHRGGQPGFVDVRIADGRTLLVVPDFAGNSAFSTFGNLSLVPEAGLLFVDFSAGHVLMLTGEAEVIWDTPEVAAFPGAQRLLAFRPRDGLLVDHALPLRWSPPEPAPQIAATGTWADLARAEDDTVRAHAWRSLVVTRVEEECEGVRSFHLAAADGGPVARHRPGQFLPIAVDLPGVPQALRRTYTIASAADGHGYRLTVKRSLPQPGRASLSNWLHDNARAGTLLRALAPRGDFVLDRDSAKPVLLLSGGIGITPMMAMVDHLTGGASGRAPQPDRTVVLLQVARNGREHAFGRHLRWLAGRHPALKLHVRYSRPLDGDVPGRDYDSCGRLDAPLLRSLLPEQCDVYLCGPAGFMESAHRLLTELGVAGDRIRAEAFGPARLPRRAAAPGPARAEPASQAEVTFRRTGQRVAWTPAEGSLLDLAEAAGIEAPWSCRAGVCGTCRTRITEGSVVHPDELVADCGATEALICSAVPASPALVLDL